jgi:hypothetical protein
MSKDWSSANESGGSQG